MIRFYSPILLLQLFCLYHAYSNNAEQRWYWFILFFPLFGCLIYLYHHFYSRQNIENLSEGIKESFNQNYRLEKLEKELDFSDTVSNKMLLAQEYMKKGAYAKAMLLYKSCLTGVHKDDPAILKKLVESCYQIGHYEQAVQYGKQLKNDKPFTQSKERIALAWSYYHIHDIKTAQQNFEAMNNRFSNYEHRLDYAKFLNKIGELEESKTLLAEMLREMDAMDRNEKRAKRNIHHKIQAYQQQLS